MCISTYYELKLNVNEKIETYYNISFCLKKLNTKKYTIMLIKINANYLWKNTNIIYDRRQTCLNILHWYIFGDNPNALPLIIAELKQTCLKILNW